MNNEHHMKLGNKLKRASSLEEKKFINDLLKLSKRLALALIMTNITLKGKP
jgi:hypothetical protein